MQVKKWFRPFEVVEQRQRLLIIGIWILLVLGYWF